MGRYSNCTYFHTLYEAVEEVFPYISPSDATTVLRETILAPQDYELEINDNVYSQERLLGMFGHTLSRKCIHEDKQTTYSHFIENTAEVIKNMNDGYISEDNYQERSFLLDKISCYEFMLFSALAFTKAANEDNSLFFGELKMNIIRFREIKDLIETYTPDIVNEETTVQAFERAKPIYKMLKSLQTLGYDYNLSTKEKNSLGINHEEDDDLTDRFNFHNWLKRLMLLQLRKEISAPLPKTSSANTVTKSENLSEIERIKQLRGIYMKRRFDINRFNMLEQSKEGTETTK